MGSNQSNPSENPQPNQGEASQPVAEQPQNEAQENIEESEVNIFKRSILMQINCQTRLDRNIEIQF